MAWLSATKKAIKYSGGVTAVAEALDVTPQRVSNWNRRGSIPPTYVLSVEKLSGVSRHKLRPDIYGSK